jgi:hypothetical protein
MGRRGGVDGANDCSLTEARGHRGTAAYCRPFLRASAPPRETERWSSAKRGMPERSPLGTPPSVVALSSTVPGRGRWCLANYTGRGLGNALTQSRKGPKTQRGRGGRCSSLRLGDSPGRCGEAALWGGRTTVLSRRHGGTEGLPPTAAHSSAPLRLRARLNAGRPQRGGCRSGARWARHPPSWRVLPQRRGGGDGVWQTIREGGWEMP